MTLLKTKNATIKNQFPFLLIIICVLLSTKTSAINYTEKSAYIVKNETIVKVYLKDNKPQCETSHTLTIQLNDEKAISIYRSGSIEYSSFETVKKLEAYVKAPNENGKIKTIDVKEFIKSDSKTQSVFYDDSKEINFQFAGLVPGASTTYNSVIVNTECHYFSPFYFSNGITSQLATYTVIVDNDIEISFFKKNMDKKNVKYTEEKKKKETTYTWTLSDTEPEDTYEDSPPASYIYPHIIPIINYIHINNTKQPYLNNVDDLYAWYNQNMKGVNETMSPHIKVVSDSITKGLSNETEKIKAIYSWAQKNIKYIAFEDGMGGLVPRSAESVCMKKYGDCKDIASLQHQLLKAANIPSYITWIGTRRIPYTYTELPCKNSDNHMIVAVKQNNEWIFLDGTDPNGIYGLPSNHIQGKQALIGIDEKKYELVKVPIVSSKENLIMDTLDITPQNENLDVHATFTYNGLSANIILSDILYNTKKENDELVLGICSFSNANVEVIDYTTSTSSNNNLVIKAHYVVKNCIKKLANENYVNFFIDKINTNDNIEIDKRKVPVNYRYNAGHHIVYNFTVPDTYTLENTFKNKQLKHPHFSTSFNYSTTKNSIQCIQTSSMNFDDLQLQLSDFEEWNKMITLLKNEYKQSITFIKK